MNIYYPKSLRSPSIYPGHIQINFFERENLFSSGLEDTVHLVMPDTMITATPIQWDDFSMTKAALKSVNALSDWLRFKAESAGDVSKTGLGTAILNAAAIGDLDKNLLSWATGKIINPYYFVIFRGIGLRRFNYTFKFTPKESVDCKTIYQIIQMIRKYSLPAGQGPGNVFLDYPGECEVKFIFKGKKNPWIHKTKRCVIEDLNINHTGVGTWAMLRNGFPVETQISLRLLEIELTLRDDVDKGY